MAEHAPTPTPWKLCENMSSEICIGTDEDDPWFIAEMCLGAGGGDILEPAAANAALIVKAVNEHAKLVQTRATFLGYLQAENGCKRNGRTCREKCGCDLELQELVKSFSADVGGSPK